MKYYIGPLVFLALAAFAVPAQSELIDWELAEFQPDIPFGGRANTIAVNPSDNHIIFVASESGGLFKTTDGGISWSHVDTLGAYYTSAVAYVTSDILLATTTDRFSTGNDGGGIWRSTDGGVNWSHIANPAPVSAPWRFKANKISIAPDTGHIYVATSWGVLESNDQGINWDLKTPFGNFEVSSVAAQKGNVVIASTFDSRASIQNVARSDDGGANWSGTNFPVPILDIHALAASPVDAKTFYAYGDPDFYVSEDGGANWSKIVPTFSRGPQDWCGGIGFVKPLATPDLTLWLGNRCDVAQLVPSKISGTSHFDYSGSVTVSTVDHPDSRDMAFGTQTPFTPILLATDGGVHLTSDNGRTWNLTGSGPNGYNALQIAEVKGQWIDNAAKYDLYLAIQDNGIWASGDGGLSWPPPKRGPEGLNLDMQKHVPSPADSVVTARVCGNCTNQVGGELLSGMHQWPDPPGNVVGHPTIVSKPFHDQGVDASGGFQKGFAATDDLGSTWSQYAVVAEELRDIPKLSMIGVAPSGRNFIVPVQYQAIKTGFDITQNFEIVQLVRMTKNPRRTTARVYYPAMNGFKGIGINPPDPWMWYHVFGVDPKDSQHLIAPDVIGGKIMESHDGGDDWSEIPGLTSLITDNGRFQFNSWAFPFASHVAFSSDHPSSVAIGTQQNGLFVSADRGATWSKVPKSERATAITSVEWMSATDAFVSTLGRGLWKLTGTPIVKSVSSLCAVQPCLLKYVFTGDPGPERFQRGIVVFEGEIMGARVEDGVLRELSVAPQTSVGFVGSPVKLAIRYTNERIGLTGITAGETFALPSGRLMTGLALDERGGPVGALYTSARIPLAEKITTRPGVRSAEARFVLQQNRSPTLSKPYISLAATKKAMDDIAPKDRLTLTGERMPRDAVPEIVLDGRPMAKPDRGRSGVVKTTIKAPKELGLHTVIVCDANTKRTIDGAVFVVRPRDVD
jgi:photosystem II stability/assembly factor-like uncharacterized protein